MRPMTSRQIHNAIEMALREVPHALASGELDRSGRYYSDTELKKRVLPIESSQANGKKLRRMDVAPTRKSA